jgi:hypothetical protein
VQHRDEPQRIGGEAVIELHRERVLEEIAPQRRFEEQARAVRHEGPVDQRPGVVDETGAQARDQRAEIDLREHEREQRQRSRPDARGNGNRRTLREPLRGPQDDAEDGAGKREMECEAVLRHADAVREAGGHHPPAHRTERRSHSEDDPQPRAQRRLEGAAPQEKKERQQERGAHEPRQHAVRPFPPVDGLELIEAHACIALAVLRDLLVLVELGLPGRLIERRQHAGDRLPFNDGEAGLGEPGRAAHHHRHHHQRRDRQQPQPHGAALGGCRRRRNRRHARACWLRLLGTARTI